MLPSSEPPTMDDFAPRSYQTQLKEICLAKNTIVYLPTGSGKTFVALMVMKEISYQVRNTIEEGGKRTFFLANTVALAKQQAQFFFRHMPFNVKLYTSEVNVDAWKSDRWHKEFNDGQIIICTAQILLDVLRHRYMNPTNINLIVFDECHRAVGQHPMHAIMKEIVAVPAKDRPRVIGLSGTLLFKELKMPQHVPAELERLENTFNATIATVASYDEYAHVVSFSTNPEEIMLPYHKSTMHLSPVVTSILSRIDTFLQWVQDIYLPEYSTQSSRTLLKSAAKPTKEIKKGLQEFKFQMQELGLYPGSLAILAVIVQLEISKRHAQCDKARHVYRAAISFCDMVRHELVEAMSGFSVQRQILNFSTDRTIKLLQFLEMSYRTTEDQHKQAIVFVERRFTAKVLYHLIKIYFRARSDSTEEPFVKPEFIVGSNATMEESIETILVSKEDRRVIENFRKHKINLLCATNVLEEGIDLQICNIVIMFDQPKTYSSFMQSKGRARMKTSKYVLMTSTDELTSFAGRMKLYRAIEANLKEVLIGKTINRPEPLATDVEKELLDDLVPPFYTPFGAKLDLLSAIQLLNRYCMTMPRDMFTQSNVSWERTDKTPESIIVSVKLPLQSTVRELISGQPMANVKLAKQSAAFNACKKLYEAGELNMNLLPVSKNDKVEELSERYFQNWRKMSNETKTKEVGTMKYVRGYKICYPKETTGGTPSADGESCYVYIIRLRADFDASERIENVKLFNELYNSGNNFGILTRNKLPPLAKIKLFVTLGPIDVVVMPTPVPITLVPDSAELRMLKRFHLMLFRDLLKVWKPFTVLDALPEENGFIIVPMLRSEVIDWELVKKFQYLRPATELSTRARQQLRFDPQDYQLRVVHPWYKNDPDKNHVVVQVREDLRPTSAFPNEKYDSYEAYFKTEHHQVIVRREDQFLIEVKGITTNLNRLHPGGESDGATTTRTRFWEFQEILIPELVHNFEFPAEYWLKATLLPSTLHRVHYLLLAEDIRMDLALNAQIGSVQCEKLDDVVVDRLLSTVGQKSNDRYKQDDDDDDDDDEDDECDDALEVGKEQSEVKSPDRKHLFSLLETIHSESVSAVDQLTYPWDKNEEPKDLDRNWETLSKIDLDYYSLFVNKYNPKAGNIVNTVYRSLTESNVEQELAKMDLKSDVKKEPAVVPMPLPAITDGFERPGEIAMLKLTMENTANVCLQQADLLQAITTKSSGDVFNLERFEVLGDAFLKFSVSVYILFRHTSWHEGYLTCCKSRMVSNRNLLYCAMSYGLPGKIKVHTFDPKNDWVPPLSSVPFPIRKAMVEASESPALLYNLKLSEEEIQQGVATQTTIEKFLPLIEKVAQPARSTLHSVLHQVQIPDKVVADATEALMGVCVKTVGYERSFRVLSHLGIIPQQEDVLKQLQTATYPIGDYYPVRHKVDQLLCNPDRIESILGYKFQNRLYLLQAFTHSSAMSHSLTSTYQQLEFLGDAVLDFLVSMYIFERNPTMSPGQLTDLRSALVNNVNLACILVRYELHLYILSQSPMLTDTIGKFVDVQRHNKNRTGDWVRLLTEESDMPMAEYVDVPKVLGDVLEALIGAIYLDSKNDLTVVWQVCYRLMRDEIASFSRNTPIQVVRQLHEHPEAKPHFSAPIVEDEVVYVKLSYTHRSQRCKVYGFGKNKEDARRAAAKIALSKMA